MEILYQDNRILVCLKPPGILSTDEVGGMPALLRAQLGDEHACVRTVHRLDRVVGGVMVFARSREANRHLCMQVSARQMEKTYLAVVHGCVELHEGELRDWLLRSRAERKTYLAAGPEPGAQEAVLRYRVLAVREELSLMQIALQTGRTHQIRAQFSGHGYPLVGDRKYGAPEDEPGAHEIALWSYRLAFCHPQTGERLSFAALPPEKRPWTAFPELGRLGEEERGVEK